MMKKDVWVVEATCVMKFIVGFDKPVIKEVAYFALNDPDDPSLDITDEELLEVKDVISVR